MNYSKYELLAIVVLVLGMFISVYLYTSYENRKAYYQCLKTAAEISSEQTKKNGGGIVSLPYCRN